ncbi:MAG TPA: glutamine synthetase family protein [Stellaceae bacterium]|nr:glutamine synthetase family protein [Stellaceae bacterium]
MSFVAKHELRSKDQAKRADDVLKRIAADKIEVVRLSIADQHGVLRGKAVTAAEMPGAMENGWSFSTTLLLKDTSHRTVYPVFSAGGGFGMKEMEGAADLVMVPDPSTFRVLPWAPHSGWMLCDLYFPDGRKMPLSTRQLYRDLLDRLGDAGYDYVAGLEVEFHIFKLDDPSLKPTDTGQPGQPGNPPAVSLLTQGYQYLTELRYDQLDPVFEILRRDLAALDLPLRSLEVEFGPSQVELTFPAGTGMAPADNMILFRSAAKQICRRYGYLASFMCRPRLPNVMSSGWHLHQSLRDRKTGKNAFTDETALLSPVGRHYLAGLLEHAAAAASFTTPTVNGYKRYRPYSLAPDRAIWGSDNRGTMLRVIGAPGDTITHIENRAGEPAANPYLYMGSQIASGLDGIGRGLEPPQAANNPYETEATMLPRHLGEALEALRGNDCLRDGFGAAFVDCYRQIKEAELARYLLDVSDWEQREYFDLF